MGAMNFLFLKSGRGSKTERRGVKWKREEWKVKKEVKKERKGGRKGKED